MLRMPTKAAIVAEERGLLERQRVFRCAADRVTAALAQCPSVEAIALIGSVARPLRREVPRFAPYKQLRVPIAHECKDVDLSLIHISEPTRRTPISYAVFCLKKK